VLEPIAYLVLVAVGSLASATYVAVGLRQGARRDLVLLRVGRTALVCSFLLGISVGSFYSHGFDIPWWGSSLFGGVCMLLSAVLALLASHLVGLKKHNKPLQSIARKNARSG
jgi:hypothetical protein